MQQGGRCDRKESPRTRWGGGVSRRTPSDNWSVCQLREGFMCISYTSYICAGEIENQRDGGAQTQQGVVGRRVAEHATGGEARGGEGGVTSSAPHEMNCRWFQFREELD